MTPQPQLSGYQTTPELDAARESVEIALQRAARVRKEIDDTAAEIQTLEPAVRQLSQDVADLEVERSLADDAAVKKLDAEIRKASAESDSKTRDLNRARTRLQALEAKAPELDAAVRSVASELQTEVSIWVGSAIHTLTTEAEEAIRPMLAIMAKAKAIGACGGSAALRDFLVAAYVPSPEACMRLAGDTANIGVNLLNAEPDPEQRAGADAISRCLEPARKALAAAKAHPDYVPLAKRPKPYVRKGWTTEGVHGNERPFGEKAAPMGPKPLPQSTGFKRTLNSDGSPIDGEVGHQTVNNMMRGESFAV